MTKTVQQRVRVTRSVPLPDLRRIGGYAKAPEFGPRLLFFSGGSALYGMTRQLKHFSHNSIHLVTPFDSGGSSAPLRKAFAMPAIGDLRNRLMALADDSLLGNPEVYQLFRYRLPQDRSLAKLRKILKAMLVGEHELVADIPVDTRLIICSQLQHVIDALPTRFNLRGASIGNLVLTGGYLASGNNLDATLTIFSKMVNAQGTVRPIVDDNVHLGAELEDGSIVLGQHQLTGKEAEPISSPIRRLFLSESQKHYRPVTVPLRRKNRQAIVNADLICYAPGSFYTSLLANLLPSGVGKAIATTTCPKVWIPNLGLDPELLGVSFDAMLDTLTDRLNADAKGAPVSALLNVILLDGRQGQCLSEKTRARIQSLGIELIDLPLVSKKSAPYYDDSRLLQVLLSLA